MEIIRQIADRARQQEFQNARSLGFDFVAAIEMSWNVHNEIVMLGRAAILERNV